MGISRPRGYLAMHLAIVQPETVRTGSGARAVQIVYFSHRGSRQIEQIGSAHDDAELVLKASPGSG